MDESQDPTIHVGQGTTPAAGAPSPLNPGERFGKFLRQEKIGAGGMGEVWKAWDTELKRPVALKFLRGSDGEELARFRREAQTAAQLNHPNIAAVYEAHDQYIAMQFVDGQTLQSYPRHNLRGLVEIVRQAALAVQSAHDKGVIHRDLKPANLMVTGTGSPHVYVMDFGLAKSTTVASSLSVSGSILGTPAYMPPEQARGRVNDVTPASDVYGLGATLYELATDRPPFKGANIYEILKRVVEEEPKAPRKANARVDADLETIVLKCMEKSPARRYGSARELADELGRWLEGEPILARPVSALERTIRRLRRHKALVVTAAALVLVVAGASALLVVQKANAGKVLAREKAERERREKGLQKLNTLWSRIVECKRELRQLRVVAPLARTELASAVEDVDEHIAGWPDDPQGYYVRARGHLYLQEEARAEADLRAALAKRPDFRPGWSLLGVLLLERCQTAQIGPQHRVDAGASLAPAAAEALAAFEKGWQQGREEKEAELWGLPWTREDQVMELLARALVARTRGARDEAVRLLSEGFETYQAEEYAFWIGVWSLTSAERLRWFDKAILLARGYDRPYLDRSVARLHADNPAGAAADATSYLELGGHPLYGLCNRAGAYTLLGKLDAALADLDRVLEAHPSSAAAYKLRGDAWARWPDVGKARADYDRAIGLAGDQADLFVARASLRESTGDGSGALTDLDRAVALDANSATAVSDRAFLKCALGDLAGAEADFTRVIDLTPDDPRPYSLRGQMRQRQRNFNGATEDYGRAMTRGIRDATIFANRGSAREALGDIAGAIEDCTEALRLAESGSEFQQSVQVILKRLKQKE